MLCPGYSFINKGKVGKGRRPSFSSVDIMLLPSVPTPGWAGEFSCFYTIKLGPQIIVFYLSREL